MDTNVMWEPAPEVSVIIPVFNEEESLPLLCNRLADVLGPRDERYELIVIDDGSSDSSFQVLKSLCEDNPNLRVIRLRRNFGQTAALVAGFDQARGDKIVTMDADLQNNPADCPRLLSKDFTEHHVGITSRRRRLRASA